MENESLFQLALDQINFITRMEPMTNLANNSSTILFTTSTLPSTTTPIVINTHPFLQTTACQTVAGLFTWAAILITGHHVKSISRTKSD